MSKYGFNDFRTTCSDQTCKAENLVFMQCEANLTEVRFKADIFAAEDLLCTDALGFSWILVADVTPNHQLDNIVRSNL